MAAGAVICGLFALAVGLDYMGADEDVNVPRWIVGWIGGLFVAAGLILGVPAWLRTRAIPSGPVWRRDRRWNRRGIGDDSGLRLRAHFYGLLGTGLFLVPFHAIWMQGNVGEYKSLFDFAIGFWAVLILLFDLILLGSFLHLLWRLWARLRFGRSRLDFANFPYRLGGRLESRLHMNRKLADTDVELELRCVQDRVVLCGSGDNERSEVQAYALYCERQRLRTDARGQAQVRFQLPPDLSPTNLRADPAHYWELVVSAERSGPDFQSVFLLPVYA